jgi:hypothetical protein
VVWYYQVWLPCGRRLAVEVDGPSHFLVDFGRAHARQVRVII